MGTILYTSFFSLISDRKYGKSRWKLILKILVFQPSVLFTFNSFLWGVAIARWIRLCIPSCCPEFESQAHHLCFLKNHFNSLCYLNQLRSTRSRNEKSKIRTLFSKNLSNLLWLFRRNCSEQQHLLQRRHPCIALIILLLQSCASSQPNLQGY